MMARRWRNSSRRPAKRVSATVCRPPTISVIGSSDAGASAMIRAANSGISSPPNSTSRLSAKCREKVADAGRTVVTGAGFGVTATESVVVKLCQGRPAPAIVRVDMIPSLALALALALACGGEYVIEGRADQMAEGRH
jgi:hypothetical protein